MGLGRTCAKLSLIAVVSRFITSWFYSYLAAVAVVKILWRHMVGYLRSERFGKDVYFMIPFSVFLE